MINLLWICVCVFFEVANYILEAPLWYEFISIYWDLKRNIGQFCGYIRCSRSEGWCIFPSKAVDNPMFLFLFFFFLLDYMAVFWAVLQSSRKIPVIILESQHHEKKLKPRKLSLHALYNRGEQRFSGFCKRSRNKHPIKLISNDVDKTFHRIN